MALPTDIFASHDRRSADCIYLDYAATTPLDRRVLDLMYSIMAKDITGNAQSTHHPFGAAADLIVRKAREQVATMIGASPSEIVFTSGATESNNLAIKGLVSHLKAVGKTRIVTTEVEHHSVLKPLAQLEALGFEIVRLLPRPCGMITADMIERAIDARTGLVCVQAVNNELGTIQPLAKIAEVLKERNILFHCDAAQALGKIPFLVDSVAVDFASFSAHKIYGPQGIGCLYVRTEKSTLLEPLLAGGGHEHGLRSGSLPVALCAGFGAACSLVDDDDRARLQSMRVSFMARIRRLNPVVYGHCEPHGNVPGILTIRFPGIDSETLVMALPGLAIGIGAACTRNGAKLSHVIQAVAGAQPSRETVRISFGRLTTVEEMGNAAEQIVAAVAGIRELQEVS